MRPTKRERAEFGVYCRYIANKLGLRDWSITIKYKEPDSPDRQDKEKWGATSYSTPGRKHVCITFPPDIRYWDPEELRECVTHELVHPHFINLSEIVREDLHGMLAGGEYYLVNQNHTKWLEYGVDAIAEAMAPKLELIKWPEKKGNKMNRRIYEIIICKQCKAQVVGSAHGTICPHCGPKEVECINVERVRVVKS